MIDSPDRAQALAEHLLDPTRSKPVVVVTTAADQSRPYINVDDIIDAVRELADVYVLPTGSITFALSDRLPQKTQVYGGAGRVYPVDRSWQSDPYASPLRFAWGSAQGPVATDKLIADALGAAHSTGLDAQRIGATMVHVEGRVKGLIAPSRAWVRTDDGGDAAIWLDLLRPGLTLEQTFQVGMRISGALDVEERRIDVSASLRKSADALANYAVGAVVLGRVVELDNIAASVELFPDARASMSAKEVTGNPLDRLTSLMSVGEVLPVRVITRGRQDGRGWRLSTLDVEDSEGVLVSPSLLPGGPPWLVMAAIPPEETTAPQRIERVEQSVTSFVDEPPSRPDAPESSAPNGKAATQPVPAADAADDAVKLLQRQIKKLEKQLLRSSASESAFQVERDGFREQVSRSYAKVQQLDRSAEKARTDLRLEKQKSQRLEKQLKSAKTANNQSNADVLFLEPEAQFLYEVDVAYAHQIPAADKADRPRRTLRLGPKFLETLNALEGVDRAKVVAVTVEIITDLVHTLDSREPHPLRAGEGAAERAVIRPKDGAQCMRVALQRRTPSARRLHYWRLGDAIELSRVVRHDDMTP